MEKLFHLKENGTNVKTEVMAGITTFLAMAYILAVNPSMLGDAGMNSQGVFMATALAAAVATIVMALLANYPIALASGMGLNAYFAYTICLGELADQANRLADRPHRHPGGRHYLHHSFRVQVP